LAVLAEGGGNAQQGVEGGILRSHDGFLWGSAMLCPENILRLCFAAILTKVLFSPK